MTAPTDAATFSPALRIVFVCNAVLWLIAQPPWFEAAALSTAAALAGAAMWAMLAIAGNRPGWPRRLTLAAALTYLVLLALRLLSDGL